MLFGESIQLHRERCGWTQHELARRLSVRQQTVSRWEAGIAVPPPGRVVQMEDAFELERGTLLRLTGHLPAEDHSAEAARFRETLGLIPLLSDDELVLLIDSAWHVYRDRMGLTVQGASPPAAPRPEQTGVE